MGAISGPPCPMSETSDVDARTRAAHAARVTLTELLVSTTVLALLVGATLLTLEQGHQAWTVGAARVEAQQSARAALTWLAVEVRAAGQGICAPGTPACIVTEHTRPALHVAKIQDVHFHATTDT